jgi:hypothetical protein
MIHILYTVARDLHEAQFEIVDFSEEEKGGHRAECLIS